MSYLSSLTRRLDKAFGGRVTATQQDGILTLDGALEHWDDIVRAGQMAVNRKRYIGLVNNIKPDGFEIPPMRLPTVCDDAWDGERPDVLVIGGGITGCAIARELTRWQLDVLLVEKEHDVATHASSRNDGMVHPGIDLRRGWNKKKYNDLGNRMYGDLCAELGVPFRRCGQYVCYHSPWMTALLPLAIAYWRQLGVPAHMVGRNALRRAEPRLAQSVRGAVFFPSAGVVSPYGITIAFAENAVQNGARIGLDTAVLGMEVAGGRIVSVRTNRGTIYPKLVVNAAGVFADEIAAHAGDRFFSIHPRRGTNAILDKAVGGQVLSMASPLGGNRQHKTRSKGGGVIHTVDGNLLVGPNAVETCQRENFETTAESIRTIFTRQRAVAPDLREGDIITYFTGVRAPTYEEDFVVGPGRFTRNILHAAGIQSPGITAAPAIAKDIAAMAAQMLGAARNAAFHGARAPIESTAALAPDVRHRLIQSDPEYGVIVCRCEEVSRGEIRDALRRPLPCDSIDGVKRRVRPGMGRCQGGFCTPLVAQIIAEELGIPIEQVRKGSYDSRLLSDRNKEAL